MVKNKYKYYYRRKNYNNYKKKKQKEDERKIKLILLALFFLWIFIYWLIEDIIKPHLVEFIYGGIIILTIVAIISGIYAYHLFKSNKEEKRIEQERIDSLPQKLLELQETIANFKPLKRYKNEEPYQMELAGYLKSLYEGVDIEVSKQFARPDIVIGDVAIEIKGPTTMRELKTIPDKIIKYLKHRDYLVIVLFSIEIVSDKEKNDKIYLEWKQDILNTFEKQADKIFFVEI